MALFEELHYCVYRYTDLNDGKVKYIGIVDEGTIPTRHRQHRKEDWYKSGCFVCEYVQLANKSETEALESHLIAYYRTDEYYNKAKAGWGLNSMLQIPDETQWKLVPDDTVESVLKEFRGSLQYQYDKGDLKKSAFTRNMEHLRELERVIKIERFIRSSGHIENGAAGR